jgi:hypothetical protein
MHEGENTDQSSRAHNVDVVIKSLINTVEAFDTKCRMATASNNARTILRNSVTTMREANLSLIPEWDYIEAPWNLELSTDKEAEIQESNIGKLLE